jgi:hypothetical protein
LQFAPNGRYAVGIGSLVRYDFWTGSRVIPFQEAGCGFAPNDFGHSKLGRARLDGIDERPTCR